MSDQATITRATKNKGAVKAGDGQYTFELAKVSDVQEDTSYSTGIGGIVEGERIQIGLIRKAKGSGSQLHSHPNEQWNYVLKGTLKVHVNGVETIAPPGTLIYIPANAIHGTVATPEEDVVFLVAKDLSHSVMGIPVDPSKTGAFFEPGFGPKAK